MHKSLFRNVLKHKVVIVTFPSDREGSTASLVLLTSYEQLTGAAILIWDRIAGDRNCLRGKRWELCYSKHSADENSYSHVSITTQYKCKHLFRRWDKSTAIS